MDAPRRIALPWQAPADGALGWERAGECRHHRLSPVVALPRCSGPGSVKNGEFTAAIKDEPQNLIQSPSLFVASSVVVRAPSVLALSVYTVRSP